MEKKPGDLRAASFSEKSAKAAVPGAPPKSKLPPGAVPLLPQKSVDKATVLVPQGSVDRTRKQSVPKDVGLQNFFNFKSMLTCISSSYPWNFKNYIKNLFPVKFYRLS